MRTALLIIDMQVGSFKSKSERQEAGRLVKRLNALADEMRERDGLIVFLQHDGPPGDRHHHDAPGWRLLPGLEVADADPIIGKRSCDAFLNTDLDRMLKRAGVRELIITGSATDFCVDTTVRSALARGYKTTVPSDGHITVNRPHLKADKIIEHHNAIWADFLSPVGPAHVCPCDEVFG